MSRGYQLVTFFRLGFFLPFNILRLIFQLRLRFNVDKEDDDEEINNIIIKEVFKGCNQCKRSSLEPHQLAELVKSLDNHYYRFLVENNHFIKFSNLSNTSYNMQ